MNKVLVLIILFFAIATSFAQSFEGKIIYANTFKNKKSIMSEEDWKGMVGTKSEIFFKNGNYKSVMNGKLFQWMIFISKENKVYSKSAQSQSVFWEDGTKNVEEVFNVEMNKEVIEILGYKCDELIVTSKNSIQKFYFNTGVLPLDKALIAELKLGNGFNYISKAKALPLKTIMENEEYIVEATATEIKEMKIPDSYFKIPKGMKIEKQPSNENVLK